MLVGASPCCGWMSGTAATLRNAGTPINNVQPRVPRGFDPGMGLGDGADADPNNDKIVFDLSNVIDNVTSAFENMSLLDQLLFAVDGVAAVFGSAWCGGERWRACMLAGCSW